MLQAMRDNAQGIIAKIIVFFIIIVFALFGVESIVSLGAGEEPTARVGDKDITEQDVSRLIEQQKANLRRQFGEQFDENLFSEQLLRKSAIEQLVQKNVSVTQAENMGLYASTKAVDEMIVSIPAFQLDGKFNKEQFLSILRLNGWTPLSFRDNLAQDIKVNQAQLAVSLTEYPSDFTVRLSSVMQQEKRTFSFSEIKTAALQEGVEVSEESVQSYYEKNSSRFQTPERVSVRYVALTQEQLSGDVDVSEDEVAAAYQEYIETISSKEERQARHILLEINSDRSEEAALSEINGIAAEIAAGASFAELAVRSDDIGTSGNGGDLGFSGRGVFDPAFEDVLFSLEKGQVSEPVKSEYGYHLIELVDVRGETAEPLESQRSELVQLIKTEKASALLAEQIQELSNTAFSATSIDEVADVFGVDVMASDAFTRHSGHGIAEAASVRSAAFADNVLLDRELSEVIETDAGAVVFAINEHIPPATMPLAAVQAGILSTLRREGAEAQAREQAQSIIQGLNADQQDGETSWVTVTGTLDGSTDAPKPVQEKAFSMAMNSSGIVDVEGGIAIVRLLSAETPSLEDVAVEEESRGTIAAMTGRGQLASFVKWARESIEVVTPES